MYVLLIHILLHSNSVSFYRNKPGRLYLEKLNLTYLFLYLKKHYCRYHRLSINDRRTMSVHKIKIYIPISFIHSL